MSVFFSAFLFIADDAFFDGLWDAEAMVSAVRGSTMAVALATLPLIGGVTGDGDVFFSTGGALTGTATGCGAATLPFAGLAMTAGLATALLVAALAAGFSGFFATAFGVGLAAGFLAAGLAAFFVAAFTGFFAAGLLAGDGFLAGAFFATTFFTAAFFATGFFAAGLTAFLATGFFADAFAPAAFALADALLAAAFPFEALAAVELRVVFAIFLHHLLA
uniref:hypothetical protein n=1 Tax=Rhodanobacter hydrolyticus TaxID=2250595 RepID=UPI00384C79C4